MISCNRCGNMSPASAVSCQTCGAPLVSKIEAGFGPARTFQEQPELPAWLESLRAGERSAAPADNPANFSPADLIEEGSLPSWMRSGRPEAGMSGAYPKLRPSSAPGPNTDDSKGINAKSLIDEQSLPSWMQEGTQQPTGSIPQNGIPAASLLQQDVAPDWMRSLQSQQLATSNPALPTIPPMSPQPSAFPAQPGFPGAAGSPMRPAQGFSAGDLVDQQSLPSWMKEDKGSSVPTRSASGGLSSSSLLDPNSMPPWLRENAQQEQRNAGMPPTAANQPWQSAPFPMTDPPLQQSPVWQPQAPNNAPTQGNNLAASSFIDPNALPTWLRSGPEQPYQQGTPPQQAGSNPRASYGVPPRVENMRVPSRPRSELNSNENNEAAANVFASMLGVASATPNFPATPPIQSYGMPGSPMSPMQNMPPGTNMPGQPPLSSPLGYNGSQGLQGSPQGQNYAQSGPPGNGIYPMGNQGQGNYPMGNQLGGNPQYPMGGPGMPPTSNPMGGAPSGMATGTGQNAAGKPAKKGFLDIIRDWFR